MAQAKAISLSHFTKAVQSAVKAAVDRHPTLKVEIPQEVTFSYLIRGFPVPPTILNNVTFGEAQAFANEVAAQISGEAGLTAEKGVAPHGAIYSAGGHIICGIPPADQFTLKQ
jgi:hypothetical protein